MTPRGPDFADATHWSRLATEGKDATAAWQYFYDRYRGAVAALFRRLRLPPGYGADEVDDVVQAFFQEAFEREFLDRADPARGRFRGYLRIAAQRFLDSAKRKAGAAKRRPEGGVATLDASPVEPAAPSADPGRDFDRAWGQAVLTSASRRLEEFLKAAGREQDIEVFHLRVQEDRDWLEIARRLSIPEPTLRRRHRQVREMLASFLREEVRETVASDADLEAELAELRGLFSE